MYVLIVLNMLMKVQDVILKQQKMERKMASVRVSEGLKAEIKLELKIRGFKKESQVIETWMMESRNPIKSTITAHYEQENNKLKEENQSWQEQLEVETHAGSELYDKIEQTTKLLSNWLDRVVVPASLHREVLKLVKENELVHIQRSEILDLETHNSKLTDQIVKMKQSYDEVSSSIKSILKLGDPNG